MLHVRVETSDEADSMIDALSIARTALDAQSVNTSVIADNIANANTPNYAPKQVTFIPMNPGVAVGPIIASTQASVDVGSELINLMVAQQAYEAATKVASASDAMTHALLATI
jgi:flagellar hook-associated protein FlgK